MDTSPSSGRSIAITICATKSYTYALVAQATRLQGMINQTPGLKGGVVVLVGDACRDMDRAERLYREMLPAGFEVKRIIGAFQDGLKNYQNPAQLVIARMRSAAFREARQRDVDICLSLDSDVLPQAHSLECMVQMLDFNKGYYDVATCPYSSQGGGDFLGGRGTPEHPILPDFYEDERNMPRPLREKIKLHQKKLKDMGGKPGPAWLKERKAIAEEINKCPPKGDIFFLNSKSGVNPFAEEIKAIVRDSMPKKSPLAEKIVKEIEEERKFWEPHGFRRRGWHSAAYPAIGLGAVVPIEWCGFGCTLMSKQALALAQPDGYDGGGTEDLYVAWVRWYRAGLRYCSIPHAPCDHVIRDPKKKGEFILCQAYHETRDPECVGHLRIDRRPWFQQTEGEEAKAKSVKRAKKKLR